MNKTNRDTWLDILSYLVMTLVITCFILFFINDFMDLMVLMCVVLLAVCVFLLIRCRRLRKKGEEYDRLTRFLAGDMDIEELPEDLRASVLRLYSQAEGQSLQKDGRTRLEFAALQDQINPHFLYNTLDAIRSQALAIHADEIAEMTGKLSRFFRYSIRNQGDLVTVADELSNTEDYFSIQRYRFEDRFSLDCECPDLTAMRYYLPKLTLQPLVENALYHGLEPKKGSGRITIRVRKGERTLRLTISDDGVGMAEETLEQINRRFSGLEAPPEPKPGQRRTGIALYNVNRRLQLLFGLQYGLHATSTPGLGTDFEVLLPLVDEEQRSKYLHKEA